MQAGLPRRAAPFAAAALLVILAVDPADGGSGSAALALLPVLWVALYGTRRQLVAALALVTAAFLALGDNSGPHGPAAALAWAGLPALSGLAVQRIVEQARHSAAEAAARAEALLEREATLRAVGELTRTLFSSADARQATCRAAAQISRASFAHLLEPDGPTALVATATSAPTLPQLRLDENAGPSGAAVAAATGRVLVVLDAARHPAVSPRLLQATGAASVVYQPVLRDGAAAAVLVIGWRAPVVGVPQHVLSALDLLSAEAAAAIERADLLANLEAEARHDTLTGLCNRRAWDERLTDELARARRSGAPLAVALLDLDRFKAYNDRYGHQAGDRLLKEAAAAWRSELRATDMLARWGGEEFAILLPACTAREARRLLERIRGLTPSGQTCSAGIAEWDRAEDLDHFVRRADVALYEAKRAGRDRTVTAPRGPVEVTLDPGILLGEQPLPT